MDGHQQIDDEVTGLADSAKTISGAEADYEGLLALVGDRRVVLIGEASHGTHEFYRERCRITRRLIDDLGFTAVAVEGDWPDAYRVNRYVMGMSTDPDADAALGEFRASPLGCGAIKMCWDSCSGSAPAMTLSVTPPPRPGSTVSTSIVSARRSRRSSVISTRWTRPRPSGRGAGIPASTTSAQTVRSTAMRSPIGSDALRERSGRPAAGTQATGSGLSPARRLGRRRRTVLRRAERGTGA